MDKKSVLEALKKLRAEEKKRNFSQSVDIIVNLKDIDLKKPEQHVDFFAVLHHPTGKKKKICALVGPELFDEAKANCDRAIMIDDFDSFSKDKRIVKKLAAEYDFFIAQANIMPKVAAVFGKILGSRGKMPNPKAGCVVPPKTALKPLYEKLQNTARVSAKISPMIQVFVGKETLSDNDLTDNIMDIFTQLESKLPKGKNNVRNAFVKLTMSKAEKLM